MVDPGMVDHGTLPQEHWVLDGNVPRTRQQCNTGLNSIHNSIRFGIWKEIGELQSKACDHRSNMKNMASHLMCISACSQCFPSLAAAALKWILWSWKKWKSWIVYQKSLRVWMKHQFACIYSSERIKKLIGFFFLSNVVRTFTVYVSWLDFQLSVKFIQISLDILSKKCFQDTPCGTELSMNQCFNVMLVRFVIKWECHWGFGDGELFTKCSQGHEILWLILFRSLYNAFWSRWNFCINRTPVVPVRGEKRHWFVIYRLMDLLQLP